MAWIESHQELARHPKTIRLAKRLNISMREAIGCLHLLWWWALDYADEGNLSAFEDEEIAAAMLWEEDASELVEALRYARFLDPDGYLHDWDQYAGKLVDRRLANAARMRRARAETPAAPLSEPMETRSEGIAAPLSEPKKPRSSIKEGRASHVQDTCSHVLSDSTQPDQPDTTQPTKPTGPEAARAAAPTLDSDPEKDLFEYYRARIQPTARDPATDKIRARRNSFSDQELRTAIENFSADWWWMENNGRQGAPWFFRSDTQIERFVNLIPRSEQERANGTNRNGHRGAGAPGVRGSGGQASTVGLARPGERELTDDIADRLRNAGKHPRIPAAARGDG